MSAPTMLPDTCHNAQRLPLKRQDGRQVQGKLALGLQGDFRIQVRVKLDFKILLQITRVPLGREEAKNGQGSWPAAAARPHHPPFGGSDPMTALLSSSCHSCSPRGDFSLSSGAWCLQRRARLAGPGQGGFPRNQERGSGTHSGDAFLHPVHRAAS